MDMASLLEVDFTVVILFFYRSVSFEEAVGVAFTYGPEILSIFTTYQSTRMQEEFSVRFCLPLLVRFCLNMWVVNLKFWPKFD